MTDLPKKARLTDAMAAKFPFLASGQRLVADAEQPGLYLKVGKSAKSWVVQTEVRILDEQMKKARKTVRRAFASFPEVSVKDARAAAKGELAAILAGEGLGKAPAGITLGAAWGLYRAALEKDGPEPGDNLQLPQRSGGGPPLGHLARHAAGRPCDRRGRGACRGPTRRDHGGPDPREARGQLCRQRGDAHAARYLQLGT